MLKDEHKALVIEALNVYIECLTEKDLETALVNDRRGEAEEIRKEIEEIKEAKKSCLELFESER